MVETKSSAFIINFFEIASLLVKLCTLAVLLKKGSKATIEEVLKEVTVSQDDLVYAARYIELACSPERFVVLLGRIETPENQDMAVKNGIKALLAEGHTDYIDPLLTALKNNKFYNRDVEDFVVQMMFVAGAFNHNEVWTRRLHDHTAINPETYAFALFAAGEESVGSPGFEWLLATASHGDLLATEELISQKISRIPDFRDVIKQTLSSTKPEKVRLSVIGPKARAVKQVFMKEIGSVLVPEAVVDIIGSYVTEDYENTKIEQRSDSREESAPEGAKDKNRNKREDKDMKGENEDMKKGKNKNSESEGNKEGKSEGMREDWDRVLRVVYLMMSIM